MTDEEREDLNTFKHDLVKKARWWQWKAETLEKENEQLKSENEALKKQCPFKVGDTVWYLFGYEEVQPWEIQSIVILKDRYILRLGHEGTDDYNAVLSKYYGEDWFATKEECEKKAREYKENKNDD